MYTGIDHVQIAAPKGSENTCREFFSEILGMREIPKPENLRKRGGVWFQCGAHELHVGVQDPFKPAVKAHPAFSVDNIDKPKERLREFDINIIDGEPLEGADRFYIHDPFGNRLEFLQRH
ncbi:VOC family protein [Bacillus sonorensis]|uniref:VOC family protein n=1 Tax=Bacillus sonorensis TaxID=119858 RepID=UPI0018CF900E|nr:VOC family protein [Bacillus sonorensis]MBG9917363.1 glyoxalase [Bacillus sonorensis]MCY7857188.1 VOC family protein [Bacillus sonorensis]MCY8086636.1 VOC family protein [Bacillus sonorensis]MCZ0069960.1 VOC family protein [Bacillus sonorensis]MCZ0097348.1 VOC family protein [Bacillus sonorensis]